MPFTEIFNALLITYVATEYSLSASASACSKKEKNGGFISIAKTFLSARHNQIILLLMLAVNLVDRLLLLTESGSVTAAFLKRSFERLLHAPKIMLAAVLYVVVLYIDCLRHTRTRTRTRNHPQLTVKRFVGHVGVEFVKILPLYPLLVILISCGFMFLISALEHLHLPLEWLNWPLYYGTLYGPFSLVYFQVKAKIVEEGRYFIPTSTTSSTSVITRANANIDTHTNTNTNTSGKHQLRGLRLAHFGK